PEGQIFGPMADTYAFALGGALLLALTVTPVLCCLALKHLRPTPDNILVRSVRGFYLWQLDWMLRFRWVVVFVCVAAPAGAGLRGANVGWEFMPELEEGTLYLRGTSPISVSFDEVGRRTREARRILRQYPEVETVMAQIGRPDDGTDPTGYYNVEI